MAIRLNIKGVKPYLEFSPKIPNVNSNIVFGCKVYSATELVEIRDTYFALASNEKLELAFANLQSLEETADKTNPEYYDKRKELQKTISELGKEQTKLSIDFCKNQVLYIKNAVVEDANGKEITIKDTKTVEPIESLWSSPEECLAVLLESFFDTALLRDSLITSIVDIVLNLQTDARVKN